MLKENAPLSRLIVALTIALFVVACSRRLSVENQGALSSPSGSKDRNANSALVFVVAGEPQTLDASIATSLYDALVLQRIGSWLVIRDDKGELAPYLAETWSVSEDGLVYTFTLKPGITFHNGDPLTAADYVWTIERALEKQAAAAFTLGPIRDARALDELTFELRLRDPFAPFMTLLAANGPYLQPLSQRAVEEAGVGYGRHPVGVGPFRFKEWATGEKIVLERNPDFTWGPDFAHPGPPLIEEVAFTFISDDAVRLAALQAGEAHITFDLPARDLAVVSNLDSYEVLSIPFTGIDPFIAINQKIPALQDLHVRQAMNLGIDRERLVQVAAMGYGRPQYGPISPAVVGYWPGVESIGYGHDPVRARTLLQASGYTLNANGVYEKEGLPLQFTLLTSNVKGYDTAATAIADMLSQIGIDIQIELLDLGTLRQRVRFDGDYELAIGQFGYADVHLLYTVFSSHSAYPGLALQDSKLDLLLERTRSTMDAVERQGWAAQAQQYMVEQAYLVPLYNTDLYVVVDRRLRGVSMNMHADIFLFDAEFSEQ